MELSKLCRKDALFTWKIMFGRLIYWPGCERSSRFHTRTKRLTLMIEIRWMCHCQRDSLWNTDRALCSIRLCIPWKRASECDWKVWYLKYHNGLALPWNEILALRCATATVAQKSPQTVSKELDSEVLQWIHHTIPANTCPTYCNLIHIITAPTTV